MALIFPDFTKEATASGGSAVICTSFEISAVMICGEPPYGADLAIRPYRCDAALEVLLLRNRNRPLSRSAQRFCKEFGGVWRALSAATS